MLQPITLSTIRTIASMRLSSHALGHRWWVFDYARFAQNKFEIMSITLWYNALPLIIFNHALHTSSTTPNPCTNLPHNHNVHSQLQHSSVKFLNIESRYSLSHVMHPHKSNIYMYISKKSNHYKLFYFGSILYIWTSRFLIKSIYVIHIFVLEPTGLTKISTC